MNALKVPIYTPNDFVYYFRTVSGIASFGIRKDIPLAVSVTIDGTKYDAAILVDGVDYPELILLEVEYIPGESYFNYISALVYCDNKEDEKMLLEPILFDLP